MAPTGRRGSRELYVPPHRGETNVKSPAHKNSFSDERGESFDHGEGGNKVNSTVIHNSQHRYNQSQGVKSPLMQKGSTPTSPNNSFSTANDLYSSSSWFDQVEEELGSLSLSEDKMGGKRGPRDTNSPRSPGSRHPWEANTEAYRPTGGAGGGGFRPPPSPTPSTQSRYSQASTSSMRRRRRNRNNRGSQNQGYGDRAGSAEGFGKMTGFGRGRGMKGNQNRYNEDDQSRPYPKEENWRHSIAVTGQNADYNRRQFENDAEDDDRSVASLAMSEHNSQRRPSYQGGGDLRDRIERKRQDGARDSLPRDSHPRDSIPRDDFHSNYNYHKGRRIENLPPRLARKQQNMAAEEYRQNSVPETCGGGHQNERRRENNNRKNKKDRGHDSGDQQVAHFSQSLPRPVKNTESFEPSHEPPQMRVLFSDGSQERYPRELSTRDVVVVTGLFCPESDLSLYNSLVKELSQTGFSEKELWASWHGDSHVIANDKHNWKQSCPTFHMVLDTIKAYFRMEIKATRLNWYRTTAEWKPFHHDAAAMKDRMARTQNFTVAVSFGEERDAAFEHAKEKTVISMPQPNGCTYTFGRDVNILWRHGILQAPPDKQTDRGRISIICWGWVPQFEL